MGKDLKVKGSPRRPAPAAKPNWKQMLNEARTVTERIEAICTAISTGATLHEIEDYLDYISSTNPEADVQPHD